MSLLALRLASPLLLAALLPLAQAAEPDPWVTTWTASQQALWSGEFALPTNVPFQLWAQSARQVARISVGGARSRIVLSNEYGLQPVHIGAAAMAPALPGGVTAAGQLLRFNGQGSVVIAPGARVTSDPVPLALAPLSEVAVTLYLPRPTPFSTFHWDGRQTAYIVAGQQVLESRWKAAIPMQGRVLLSDIQVEAARTQHTVAALGDSITEGNGASVDQNQRWPDHLASRLAGQQVAVLNAGISGGRLLRDGMGVSAMARLERDVLSQPKVRAVVLAIGINDLGWSRTPFAPDEDLPTLEALQAGYRQLMARAHARQLRVVAATITPFEGALQDTPFRDYYAPDKEALRQQLNAWIRTAEMFDAVADFDATLRDPARPTRLLAAYDCGDHLHPNDAGYQAMAQGLDLMALLGKG